MGGSFAGMLMSALRRNSRSGALAFLCFDRVPGHVPVIFFGCSDFFVGNEMRSRKFSKNLVVPAKAGIHSEAARANSLWIPAFAGTTEGYTRVLPTKYPDEPIF
jgi:hypothetical protein